MRNRGISRRSFIQKSAVTAGAATLGAFEAMATPETKASQKLPREVWIGSFSQTGFTADSPGQMVDKITSHIQSKLSCQPDIVCLPENFPFNGVKKQLVLRDKIQESVKAMDKLSAFSKKNNCYAICPAITSEGGKIYNAAVVFDRKGVKVGEYRKARPTDREVEWGITPGPVYAPVFRTDFGVIGIQICFDMLWDESWAALREQGAEIVFFPSEMAGGQMVNVKACMHKYVVVSSTTKMTSKISDITGEIVAHTGFWEPNFICAPINLERALIHLWPHHRKFDDIQKKYGRNVRLKMFHEEEWGIIESLSADIKVDAILKEFDIRAFEEHKMICQTAQDKARKPI
jgi:beta-ureidopropionase